jgi:death-on-curing protein
MTPKFLVLEEVLAFHAEQLARFGGGTGIRDRGLLESALAQPEATFGGEFLHEDLAAMAAAYLFHIVQDRPFVDGNKRTGLLAALVFLDLNGAPIDAPRAELHDVVIGVASGTVSKAQLGTWLRERALRR